MARIVLRTASLLAVAAFAAGCAGGDMPNLMPTSSVTPVAEDAPPKREARVSPECVTLANQIQVLRGDGTIDRLEKTAAGKSPSVQVKRTSLAKQAELNKANADFQAKCGPRIPATTTAAAPAPAVKAAAPSGVTVATPKTN